MYVGTFSIHLMNQISEVNRHQIIQMSVFFCEKYMPKIVWKTKVGGPSVESPLF